eukprot:gene7271-5116_t
MFFFGTPLRLCLRGVRELPSDANPSTFKRWKEELKTGSGPMKLKVAFLHPDLGIGGAERLVVDACIGLQSLPSRCSCQATIVTTHHTAARAFKETTDGTIPVVVFGDWLPHSAWGRGVVLFSTIRMLYAAFRLCSSYPEVDVVVVDQVPTALRMLKGLSPFLPRLFYAHFPDQRCDANRDEAGNFHNPNTPQVVRAYRRYFDDLEKTSMEAATKILCNSKFSRGVTLEVFPNLFDRVGEEDVLYPPAPALEDLDGLSSAADPALLRRLSGRTVFVSINRYERKKNLELALLAFVKARALLRRTAAAPPLLVLAGGYDDRLQENFQYDFILRSMISQMSKRKEVKDANGNAIAPAAPVENPEDLLDDGDVVLLRNISVEDKAALLRAATAVLFTPLHEHFGIVPLEAMQAGTPVVAVRQAGPLETVGEGPDAGGLLCEPTPEAFAEAMTRITEDAALRDRLGAAGRHRVAQRFSGTAFTERLLRELLAVRDVCMKEYEERLLKEPETKKTRLTLSLAVNALLHFSIINCRTDLFHLNPCIHRRAMARAAHNNTLSEPDCSTLPPPPPLPPPSSRVRAALFILAYFLLPCPGASPSAVRAILEAEAVSQRVLMGRVGCADSCIVPRSELKVEPEATEASAGYRLVYDVMRTDSGKILFKQQHLDRIGTSFHLASSKMLDAAALGHIASGLETYMADPEVQREKTARECNLKWVAWVRPEAAGVDTAFAVFYIRSFFPPEEWYRSGARVGVLYEAERNDPSAKIIQTSLRSRAVSLQRELDAYEVLLMSPADRDYIIPEGSKSNYLLLTHDNKFLCSEQNDILMGVTLLGAVQAIEAAGIGPVTHQKLGLRDLLESKSIVILGSSPGTLPVREIVLYRDEEGKRLFEAAAQHSGVSLDTYASAVVRRGEEVLMMKEPHNDYIDQLIRGYTAISHGSELPISLSRFIIRPLFVALQKDALAGPRLSNERSNPWNSITKSRKRIATKKNSTVDGTNGDTLALLHLLHFTTVFLWSRSLYFALLTLYLSSAEFG